MQPGCLNGLNKQTNMSADHSSGMPHDNTREATQQPVKCANGCGFYGNPLTANCCSKCFKQKQQRPSNTFIVEFPSAEEVVPSGVVPAADFGNGNINPKRGNVNGIQPVVVEPDIQPGSRLPTQQVNTSRCWTCNKKVGLTAIKCRCGYTFCGTHRHADKHSCTFDFRGEGRAQLSTKNPKVVASKLDNHV